MIYGMPFIRYNLWISLVSYYSNLMNIMYIIMYTMYIMCLMYMQHILMYMYIITFAQAGRQIGFNARLPSTCVFSF